MSKYIEQIKDNIKKYAFSNLSLMLSKYPSKRIFEKKDGADRLNLLLSSCDCLGRSQKLYEDFFSENKNALNRLHGSSVCFEMLTSSRMIIGLGNASVLETGLTLHRTYGVPYIPGSALKGLAAHYCHKVLGVDHNNDEYKMGEWNYERNVQTGRNGTFYEVLFGNIEDDDNDASAGFITFHDAFICPDDLASSLKLDIITPHHPDYYNAGSAAPTDFDDPTPISFLSVGEGKCFQFHLTCCDTSNNGAKWLAITKKILVKALENWGIGGKTSTGYGRMALLNGTKS